MGLVVAFCAAPDSLLVQSCCAIAYQNPCTAAAIRAIPPSGAPPVQVPKPGTPDLAEHPDLPNPLRIIQISYSFEGAMMRRDTIEFLLPKRSKMLAHLPQLCSNGMASRFPGLTACTLRCAACSLRCSLIIMYLGFNASKERHRNERKPAKPNLESRLFLVKC